MADRARPRPASQFPSAVNMVLGAWLVLSVFLWEHSALDGFNTLACGLLVFTFAALARWAPPLRFASAFVGAWLLVTALFFEHPSPATLPHNVLVAGLILSMALVSGAPRRLRVRVRGAST